MRKHMKTIAMAVVALMAGGVWLFWPTDEARIKKAIASCTAAIEQKDMEALLKHISFSYQDDRGLSYALIKKMVPERLSRMGRIEVRYSDVLVEVEGEEATAVMDLTIIEHREGSEPVALLGGRESKAVLNLKFRKERVGQWLVLSSKWPPAF